MGGMPPIGNVIMGGMPSVGEDHMDTEMVGSLDTEADEVSPKKAMQQLAGKLSSEMRNYLETAEPEEAKQDALWVIQMIAKAGVDSLDNKGKKAVIKTIKSQNDEDFNGLDDSVEMADDVEEQAEKDAADANLDAETNAEMGM